MEGVKSGKTEKFDTAVVLVSAGRRPYTEGLGLEEVTKFHLFIFIYATAHTRSTAMYFLFSEIPLPTVNVMLLYTVLRLKQGFVFLVFAEPAV